jgi:hypothetical protein
MFPILLDLYIQVKLLGHMVKLYFMFWGIAKVLSKVAAPFSNPTSIVYQLQFLHIPPTLLVCLLFMTC